MLPETHPENFCKIFEHVPLTICDLECSQLVVVEKPSLDGLEVRLRVSNCPSCDTKKTNLSKELCTLYHSVCIVPPGDDIADDHE